MNQSFMSAMEVAEELGVSIVQHVMCVLFITKENRTVIC